VATNGDSRHPYTVAIKDDISGEAPHLPGKAAPKSCHGSTDCPPDFPGCSKSGESAGSEGDDNGDKSDDDSGKSSGPFKRIWVGIAGALDFQSMPKGADLCRLNPSGPNAALPANNANVYCTNADGTDFPSRADPAQNNALVQGEAGSSNGGLSRADIRLMLSFDYALNANMLVGARIGTTLFKYPGTQAYTDGRAWSVASGRLYFDARFSYLFGESAITKTVAPMVFGGVGAASFDVHSSAGITLNNGQSGTVSLWQTNGPFFVLVGGGIHLAFSESLGGTLAVRINGSTGPNGFIPTFGPEAGLVYGF
ncbi:MAG TPA: hypothetical protein VIF09_29830, partial [Polyangiaceae bacterium]